MGAIWMDQEYADELKRWQVPTEFADGCWKRARSSGGYDGLLGIIIHHDGSGLLATLASMLGWATVSSPNKPIGSGTGSRKRLGSKWLLWAAGATNTAGRGGPFLNSAGEVVPRDAGNRLTVNTEWMNRGDGSEDWAEDDCDLYVRWCCATLSWINKVRKRLGRAALTVADIIAHFEWAPTRKTDPYGRCRWNGYRIAKWNMDNFRQEVFFHLIDGPGPLRRFDPKLGRVPDRDGAAIPPPPPAEGPDFAAGDYGLWPMNTAKETVRKGSLGDAVRYLQAVIAQRAGGAIVIDGQFGLQTESRVKDVQLQFGLKVDGVVGPAETWPVIDFLATQISDKTDPIPEPSPEPKPEPATEPVVEPVPIEAPPVPIVEHGQYRLRENEWAYAVARRVLRDPSRYREIQAINRSADLWKPGEYVAVPEFTSIIVKVAAGKGLYDAIQRAFPDDDPRIREEATWEWNGGRHVLKPDEMLSIPRDWKL